MRSTINSAIINYKVNYYLLGGYKSSNDRVRIAQDKKQKERQKQIDNELRRLVAAGYSIHEAETIIANTVLENLK